MCLEAGEIETETLINSLAGIILNYGSRETAERHIFPSMTFANVIHHYTTGDISHLS